jgi:hypothetical protein
MRKITAEELLNILGMDCGEYGNSGEPPDYSSSWWIDGQCKPQEIADALNRFFESEP